MHNRTTIGKTARIIGALDEDFDLQVLKRQERGGKRQERSDGEDSSDIDVIGEPVGSDE